MLHDNSQVLKSFATNKMVIAGLKDKKKKSQAILLQKTELGFLGPWNMTLWKL